MQGMDFAYEPLSDGLDVWFSAWIHTFVLIAAVPVLLAALVVVLVVASERHTRRRRFWCALQRREVETVFRTHGLLPQARAVLACSAFESPRAVACGRRCLEARYRRQWPAPLAGRGD